MPVAHSADHPSFELGGNTITGLMAPSRGSTDNILYRIDVPPGGKLPPHRHDHEDMFTIVGGSATAHVGDASEPVSPGDAVVVPTGATHWVEAGPEGCVLLVAMLAGTLFIRDDGTSAVPPWGE